jgi:tripartite-type tricarboxylate transporter receptor subunit TctC
VPDYEALQWFGLMARSGTPPEILNRLQKLIADAMRSPEMQARLQTEGADAVVNTPDEFQKLIAIEIDRWTKLAKAINLQPE